MNTENVFEDNGALALAVRDTALIPLSSALFGLGREGGEGVDGKGAGKESRLINMYEKSLRLQNECPTRFIQSSTHALVHMHTHPALPCDGDSSSVFDAPHSGTESVAPPGLV